MKSSIILTQVLVLFFGLFIYTNVNAITYTTINPGSWSDVTNVWSTDGGVTPCGCSPGVAITSDTVIVNHVLSVLPNLSFNASHVAVNATGSISGSINVSASNSNIDLNGGSLNASTFTQSGSTTLDLTANAILITTGQFIIGGGTVTVDNSLLSTGQMNISLTGVMNLQNGARLNVHTSNLRNRGVINIDPTSCVSTSGGNIQNNSTGAINGSGSLNSGGNIVNSGFIDPNLIWCSNGAGLGMPTPPDCANANTICSAIVLPVDLTSFDAIVNEEYTTVTWETASESNSSHFILLKSTDGKSWESIARIQAAGTTTSSSYYTTDDLELSYGTSYYMLEQYDVDGAMTVYDPISINRETPKVEIGAYPNPVANGGNIHVTSVSGDNGSVKLISLSGMVVQQLDFSTFDGTVELPVNNVAPGTYILLAETSGSVQSTKVIITE